MIKIDGSHGEAGGQIIRTALSFSTLSQKPFEVSQIRKGRKDPGLKQQHLYGIKALKQLCSAICDGDELGSTNLRFYPRKFTTKNIDIDIETAGSITLFMQSVLLPCMFGSRIMTISVKGGTDVSWSPSWDYFSNILIPQLNRFAKIEVKLLRRGYYPKGNGNAEIKISPRYRIIDFDNFENFIVYLNQTVPKFNLLQQHKLIQIKGISHASKTLQNANVAQRQAHSAQAILGKKFNVPIKISSEYQDTLSTGSGITLWAIFSKNTGDIDEFNPIRIGSDVLGEQGEKSETVGEECANKLIKEIESKAPCDHFLCDQLLAYLALCGGSIKSSSISPHAKSNIYSIEQFLGKLFVIDEKNSIISIK